MLKNSTVQLGVPQADGRCPVTELHEADDGQVYSFEYLSDGTLDPDFVMQQRAIVINTTLAAREAARVAVAGTSVPLTRYEFLSRFTPNERVAIREIAKTDHIVEDFMEMMKLSGNVLLPLTRPALAYLAYNFPSVLTTQRASEIGAE